MASKLVLREEQRPIGGVGGGGGGGGGGLKLSVLIEAYLQPCISDNLIRTCLGEDDCQKQQKCHECSELTVSIGIDIWKHCAKNLVYASVYFCVYFAYTINIPRVVYISNIHLVYFKNP